MQPGAPLQAPMDMLFLDNILSPAECAAAIAAADELFPAEAAPMEYGNRDESLRRSSVQWLTEHDRTDFLFRKLGMLMMSLNPATFGLDVFGFREPMQLATYRADEQGFFDWHVDRGKAPGTRSRKLSCTIQLSDPADYDGGELLLNAEGTPVQAPKEQGTMILFPSYVLHTVRPVTRGVRKALVVWMHGPPLR